MSASLVVMGIPRFDMGETIMQDSGRTCIIKGWTYRLTFLFPVPREREFDGGGRSGRRGGGSPSYHERDRRARLSEDLHCSRVLHIL